MREGPPVGMVNQDDREDYDPQDIYAMHDKNGNRDIPKFVFPWAGEKDEEDGNLKELFEAGAGFVYFM